jgi:uncharacterized coiled-coil DUF342 family protein
MESALKELKAAAGKIKDADAIGDNPKSQKNINRVYITQRDDDKKISAEVKAEIDKASAKVKELARELQSKQKELREAQRNLSQLQGKIHAATVVARVNIDGKKTIGGNKSPSGNKSPGLTIAPMGRMGVMTPSNTVERRVTVRRDVDSGQKRIDDLEKKLEKLLDEVAALKKDRAK